MLTWDTPPHAADLSIVNHQEVWQSKELRHQKGRPSPYSSPDAGLAAKVRLPAGVPVGLGVATAFAVRLPLWCVNARRSAPTEASPSTHSALGQRTLVRQRTAERANGGEPVNALGPRSTHSGALTGSESASTHQTASMHSPLRQRTIVR